MRTHKFSKVVNLFVLEWALGRDTMPIVGALTTAGSYSVEPKVKSVGFVPGDGCLPSFCGMLSVTDAATNAIDDSPLKSDST
jgi:hypothetical protein